MFKTAYVTCLGQKLALLHFQQMLIESFDSPWFFCVRPIETFIVPGRGLPLYMPYSEGNVEMINSYLTVDLSMEGETSLSIVDIVIAHSPLYPVKCSQLPHWIFSSFLFGEVIIRSREFHQTTIPSP